MPRFDCDALDRRSSAPYSFSRDAHAGRRDDDLVVALLDDVAVDLLGDLPQLVDDVFDRAVRRGVTGDVRDDEVAVVDGVFDRDHVALVADLSDVYLHPRVRVRLGEVVEVELDVVVDGAVPAAAEDLAHNTHTQ